MRIYNPARKISYYGGQRYTIELPCGQCAECREARRTEIYFRTYYQCLYTWNKNGYILFDTLTYDNEHLPHVSDFCYKIARNSSLDYSCFNRDDVRHFLVRLRRELSYHGFDVSDNLKYFVSSEYGSEQYTARPHYHILFFVTDSTLSPIELSRYINKCWQQGRTDGIDYHDYYYVMNHVYGQGFNQDQVHMQAVCNYVAKYVLKDSEFEGTLEKRIDRVFKYGREFSWLETPAGKAYYKKIMKFMRPYTRWSKGFGEYGLEYNEAEDMYNNKMRIPDKNSIWRFAPLSSYLSRKLYYEHAYDSEGHLYWRLSKLGRERALDMALKSTESFSERFEDWLNNIDILMKKGDRVDEYDFESDSWIEKDVTTEEIYRFRKNTVDKVLKYLDGRSPLEFAFYVMFYKGRVKSREQLKRESKGVYRVDDVVTFFNRGLICKQDFDDMSCDDWIYNYCHSKDMKHFQKPILSEVRLDADVEGEKGYVYHSFDYGYDYVLGKYNGDFVEKYNATHKLKVYDAESWASRNVIDENSDPRFRDFDKLYRVFCSSLRWYNKRKQDTYDYVEDLKKKLKNVSILNSRM